ncbi:hypothetical protein [Streptomyces aidingensis]|uniref:Enoyl reductase n=1 Tax=Streptomyces aidingensis TaxID=910347 RepID=A0A1I1SU03_9ACTN|nr:hypothetical protein [Streptomyces aidingensis]SFD47373.1 hypothetical protein SAMN05421773_11688 [Streptomyces aidingensis]
MLTDRARRARYARPGIAAAVLLAPMVLLGPGAGSAQADHHCREVRNEDGELVFTCEGGENGESGQDGGNGTEPTCDLSLVESSTHRWCEGENACWANIPSAAYPTPDTWPPGQPSEDSVYIYKYCLGPDGSHAYDEWGWYTPEERSLPDRAWEAFGQLATPDFGIAFSPPQQAVVALDTWWWAAGAGDGELRSASVEGVVAIAAPDRMEVDPGDGSGVLDCPFTTVKSDACTHVYEKASVNGTAQTADGTAAYPVRARLVYTVRFEEDGAPVEVPGLPETLESPWEEAPVPVTEVQGVVVDD